MGTSPPREIHSSKKRLVRKHEAEERKGRKLKANSYKRQSLKKSENEEYQTRKAKLQSTWKTENKSEEKRRRRANEKGKASERKRSVLIRKVQKGKFETVIAAAGFLWLHFISISFFVLAAGQHSQLLTFSKKEGIAYIYRLNFTYQFDYNCYLAS